jgi:hypothetical protein
MSVESAADRANMLADFGQLITFTPGAVYPNRSDKTVEIMAIFDNDFYAVDGGEVGINTRQPSIMARTADTENAARNSMVEIGNDIYKVVSPEPDGTGMTVLQLEGPK